MRCLPQDRGRGRECRTPLAGKAGLDEKGGIRMTDLGHLSEPGTEITVRVTPKASRNAVVLDDGGAIRVYVTTVPEDGKANAAVQKLLAKAVGVAKSRLELVRGQTSRDKVFLVT